MGYKIGFVRLGHIYYVMNNLSFQTEKVVRNSVTLTIQDLTRDLNEGLQSDVLFLDFSKAFDKVDYTLLLHKFRALWHTGTDIIVDNRFSF